MRRAYLAMGWGVFFIGAAHMFATTQIFPEVNARAVWFFGAGMAMSLTGALNLLNSSYGAAAPGLKKVCVAANIFMTLFALVAGRVTNASVAERVVILGLVGGAAVLSVLKSSSKFSNITAVRGEPMAAVDDLRSQRFYHGTKADLTPGDLIRPGYDSNFGSRKKAAYVYLTATLDAATWGAELAHGEGPGRIYMVEPTGPIEDDPNLTDKKYPGNPTKSYRSRDSLRVTGEVTDWQGHSPEQLKAMKDNLERLKQLGIEAIEE